MSATRPTRRPWATLLLLTLALAVVLPAALPDLLAPQATRAVAPGGNGRITFVSSTVTPEHPEGEIGIFRMSADGSGRRQLTGEEVTFSHGNIGLAVSPDGRQVAFSDDTQDIHLMDADGSNVRRITTGLFSYGPLAWSPNGNKIAYIQVGARHDIWVMNTDGSNRTRLTNNASSINTRPDWSPDGSRIVYEANPPGGGIEGIWVMDADGANGVRIAADGKDPSWSPDGERIAFTRGGDLYTMQPDGSDVVRVTNTPEFDANVTWAPAGNRLLFTTDSLQGGTDLYTIKPDGTSRQQLTQDGVSTNAVWQSGTSIPISNPPKVVQNEAIVFTRGFGQANNPDPNSEIFLIESDPFGVEVETQLTFSPAGYASGSAAWSPDGTKIAFTRSRTDGNLNPEIYVMNSDGSQQVNLTNSPLGDGGAAWSPDGSLIAFSRQSGTIQGGEEIWVMNADGSNQRRLTSTQDDVGPVWSPDGAWIAFTRWVPSTGKSDIYAMHADGSNQVNLTETPDELETVSDWSPDGNKLAFSRYNPARSIYSDIFTMLVDGTRVVNVTRTAQIGEAGAVWSPDGKRLVFSCIEDGHYDLCTMKANGSGRQVLVDSPFLENGASWRPMVSAHPRGGAADRTETSNAIPAHHNPLTGSGDKSKGKQRQKRQQEQKRNKHQRKHKQRAKQKQRQRAGEERDASRRAKTRTRRRAMSATPDRR